MSFKTIALATAALLGSSLVARADTSSTPFTVTYTLDSQTYTITGTLDSSDAHYYPSGPHAAFLAYLNETVEINGSPATVSIALYNSYEIGNNGDFSISDSGSGDPVIQETGPALFSTVGNGPSPTVTLIDGTYDLTGYNGFPDATLVLGAAPTPEPSSLMLLGTGILGGGAMLRRRFVA